MSHAMDVIMQVELEKAQALLRSHDYVVVPRDRHLRVGGDKSIDALMLQYLPPDQLPGFTKHSDDATARMIGQEMWRLGAITKTEMAGFEHGRHVWRYEAAVILPRQPGDHR